MEETDFFPKRGNSHITPHVVKVQKAIISVYYLHYTRWAYMMVQYLKTGHCVLGNLTLYIFNPLNAELNPICYLLALLGAYHFLHVSRIRVKLITFRLLMSYIYMEHPFLMFLDHTQRRSTVGRTPLDE